MAQESKGNSNRWMLLAGAATFTALAAGYVAYGYKNGWKGAAYSFWCPEKKAKKIKSPFYAKISQGATQPEIEARAWMEGYVRTSLIKKPAF